jgi:transcriptional regulator GlxA family with amidase domain
MPHRLTILALDAAVPLDLAIAAQLMGYPMAPYDVTICGPRPGQVKTTSGFAAAVSHGLRALAAADTVMIPGFSPHNRALPPPVLMALRRAHRRGARMVSICTGAFALAQAGILDGRRATTHWRHAGELAASFPAVTVDPDVLYVDQGQVLTSAGVAAGIDLCLHLIRADHGARAANAVARQVVIAPHRDGGQAQYIRQPVQAEAGASLAATRAWAQSHLAAAMTVRDLARHANVSERTFARRFRAETGTTPLRWLTTQRLATARELLEEGTLTIEEIARRCGLGSTDNLRLYFHRHLRTTPSAYRRAFSAIAAGHESGPAPATAVSHADLSAQDHRSRATGMH